MFVAMYLGNDSHFTLKHFHMPRFDKTFNKNKQKQHSHIFIEKL